jgi:predicted metal-dependent enzyme (double-stranded beta helix superfamily)
VRFNKQWHETVCSLHSLTARERRVRQNEFMRERMYFRGNHARNTLPFGQNGAGLISEIDHEDQLTKEEIVMSRTNRQEASLRQMLRVILVLISSVGLLTSSAMAGDDAVKPIAAKQLSEERTRFTDKVSMEIRLQPEGREELVIPLDDPSDIVVYEFTVQPGVAFPWHTHPGLALAGIQAGELIYIYADDCVERPYPTGTMFIDPGGDNVHTAVNPSNTEEAVVVATFLNSASEGPLTIPVDEKRGQQLDQRCKLNR